MKTKYNIVTTAIAILAVFTALAQQSTTTKDTVKLKIETNPDKVDFELRTYRPTDSELSAVGFREGWYAAEPFGPGDALNPKHENASRKLTDLDKLQDTIAVVVRWKVKAGQNLASDGIGPHLRGVTRVPDRFKTSLSKENYKAVATQLDGLGLLVQTKMSTGEFVGAHTQRDGLAQFIWFVPADTKSVELILPPHKTITVTTSSSQ
jgi:hypothetical protein